MIDLGLVDARGEANLDIPGLIGERLEEKHVPPLSMVKVTICFPDREHQRRLAEKEFADLQRGLLDLKIQVMVPGEYKRGEESRDIRSIDYIAEFDRYVSGKNMSQCDADFVRRYGSRAITLALEGDGQGAD